MDVPREYISNTVPCFLPSSCVHAFYFFSLSTMLLDDVLHIISLDILFKTNTNIIALVQLTKYVVLHMKLNISSLCFTVDTMCAFHSLHSPLLMPLRVFFFSIQIPMGYGYNIPMRALIGCVWVSSRPIPFSCKTDRY